MEPIEQLKYLKTLTVTTGVIHDAQIYQMKNYVYVIPNILSATFSIDPENKSVEYDLIFKDGAVPRQTKKFKHSLTSITEWIKYILWDETKVVFKNGDIIL